MQANPFMDKTQNSLINYKIAKCKNWEKDKTCKYGAKCTFAHGDAELRTKPENISNMSQPFSFMPFVIDQNGMPLMVQPGMGFDFNQMPMMPAGVDQNQLMMGMVPPNANIPPNNNNNEIRNQTEGGNDKNQL
jgi:hypothetical protein